MKIMILTDLEGPSGVNGRSDGIGNTILNRPTSEQALVNEVNACCDGLAAAGATEIVVLDGHGGSNSIDIFKLHPAARLLQLGGFGPASYMDSTYDAFVQIGAHGMQSSMGFLCHTFNSHAVAEMRLNGKQIGEIGISSRLAGYFNIPTILVSGDETACREAHAELGGKVATVATKQAYSRYSALNYSPEQVYADLRTAAEAALRNLAAMPCPAREKRYEMIVRLMCPNQTFSLEMLGIERLDEAAMRIVSDDFVDLWAQRNGWAPGVHNRRFGITPGWVFPGC